MTATPSPMLRDQRRPPRRELLGRQDVGAAEHRLRSQRDGQRAQDNEPETAESHGAEYTTPNAL